MTAAARAARSDFGVTAISLYLLSDVTTSLDAVALEHVLVELDAEARPGRDGDAAVGLDRQALLGQRLVDRRVGHAVLLQKPVRQHGVHVQGRSLDDAALPRVRHRLDAALPRELPDAQQLGDPAAARHVRPDEIDVAAVDQLAESPHRRVLPTRGDADVAGVRQL